MKKLIIFAFALCCMAGCTTDNPGTDSSNMRVDPLADCNVIEYDSCEYVFKLYKPGTPCGYVYFTHKGNCRFCAERAERNNKEK